MSETMSSAETTPEEAPAAEPVLSAPEAVSEAVSKAAPEAMSEATPEVAEQVAAAPNAAPAAQAEAAVTPEAHVPQAALSEPAATVEEYIAAAVEAAAPGDAVAVAESSAGVEGLPVAAESAAQTEGAPAEGAPAQGEEAAARPKRDDRRGPRGPRPDSAADAERIVRTLAVGQELEGTVKRVSEFGAFIDIGVGRDGLVHISELSIRRVGKVTDVLNEGDKHTFWIKKLDRERNRISLTLIAPGTTTMRDLNKDDLVTGTVSRILPYGAFVDIGVGRDALLHVREMGNRFIAKPEEVVKVGEQIEARIIEIQKRRGRIDLSIKGLRDEPEAEMEAPAEQTSRGGRPRAEAQPEPEVPDIMADYEVLSPMELAFRKARRESSEDASAGQAKASAADDQRQKARLAQEEAYQRTLKQK